MFSHSKKHANKTHEQKKKQSIKTFTEIIKMELLKTSKGEL